MCTAPSHACLCAINRLLVHSVAAGSSAQQFLAQGAVASILIHTVCRAGCRRQVLLQCTLHTIATGACRSASRGRFVNLCWGLSSYQPVSCVVPCTVLYCTAQNVFLFARSSRHLPVTLVWAGFYLGAVPHAAVARYADCCLTLQHCPDNGRWYPLGSRTTRCVI